MAKRLKVLLAAIVAVFCTAAVLLTVSGSKAFAVDYEYTKTTWTNFQATETPVVLVGQYNGSYYAMTANGTSLKSTKIDVADNKITSAVNDNMLWTISASGYYRIFRNVGTGTYLNNSTWGVSLSSTQKTYYNGFDLMSTDPDDYYVYINSASVGASKSTSTKYEVYLQSELSLTNAVTVTFEKGNDAATGTMNAASVESGTEYTLPACSFTYTDYTFDGWSDGTNKYAAGDTITVSADMTLTATWVYNKYNVTFVMDGQENVVKTVNKTSSYYMANFNSIFGDANAPEGKVFSHWKNVETSDETEYMSGTNYKLTGDISLTPVFVNAVTITFEGNGGTLSSTYANPIKAPENGTYKLPSFPSTCTKEGWTLTGFICSADSQLYKLGASYQLGTEDVTFTAQFEYDGYILTFKVDGEEDNVVYVEKTEDRNWDENTTYTLNVNNPTKADGVFQGWKLGDDDSKLYQKGNTLTTAQLQALTNRQGVFTAVFQMKEYVNVTYHLGTNEPVPERWEKGKSTQLKWIDAVFANWNPDNKELVFIGWATTSADETDEANIIKGSIYTNFTENTDLYAIVAERYSVTFDFLVDNGEGGTEIRTASGNTFNPVTVFYHYSQTDELPRKDGYTLKGWSLTKGGEVAYNAENGVKVLEACTLYAVWDYNYYVVKFYQGETVLKTVNVDKNGSSSIIIDNQSVQVDYDELEYEFLGWSLSLQNVSLLDTATALPISGDTNFYAVLRALGYTVTYKVDGADVRVDTFKAGAAVTPFAVPDKTGYTGVWDKEIPEVMPSENLVINAVYTINSYTVTYKAEGQADHVETYEFGAAVTPYAVPEKTGYTGAWDKEVPAEMPAENLVVTAVYTIKTFTVTFKNDDGTVLETKTVNYGEVPAYTGEVPTKEKEGKTNFTFEKWDKELTAVTADTIYTATYKTSTDKKSCNANIFGFTALATSVTLLGAAFLVRKKK